MLTSISCLLVCILGSYYLLIRYPVHCRWDTLHRIPKRMIMISRVSSSMLKFSLPPFSSSMITYLSLLWLPGLPNSHEKFSELLPLQITNTLSNTQISYHPCSFKNQQMLCFLFFSQPILKYFLCFSSLQSSFCFQIYWNETSIFLMLQRSYLFQSFRNSAGL